MRTIFPLFSQIYPKARNKSTCHIGEILRRLIDVIRDWLKYFCFSIIMWYAYNILWSDLLRWKKSPCHISEILRIIERLY